jgi:hypothetical protein
MRIRRFISLLVVAISLGAAGSGRAAVIASMSRSEALYSAETDPDCSALSQLPDDQLPWYVVRIRASVDVATSEPVTYRWSLPKPAAGFFIADQNLGTGQVTPAIQGICAEFGNSCILSDDKLRFYNQASILWVGPHCETGPATPRTPSGVTRVRVDARAGKRRLGRTTVPVGFGRIATVKLFADGEDGDLRKGGVSTGFRVIFGANANMQRSTMPQLLGFEFVNGAGGIAASDGACQVNGVSFEACSGGRGELDYPSPGPFIATVKGILADGSALCDHVAVQVLACNADGELKVLRSPHLRTYVPGDPERGTVDVRVRFTNKSQRRGTLPPCRFLLGGSNVLTCTEDLVAGGTTDSKTTRFDLPHCSHTETFGCHTDAHCRPPICDECQGSEICLTASHCSSTLDRPCSHDSDCIKPQCPTCTDQETCVHVLSMPSPAMVVAPGESLDLLAARVPLLNLLPDTALMRDTWTVTTENGFSTDTTDTYRIRGQR